MAAAIVGATIATAACADAGPLEVPPAQTGFTIMVFTRTEAYRHDSIPQGIAAIEALGARHQFEVVATEDPSQFTDSNLAQFDAVVWLSTSGDVLDEDQQAAFERYIQGGGGFVGVHAAADTEYDWPWYGELLGTFFASHPAIQEATVQIVDTAHPSTIGLPLEWTRTDEWYDFRTDPGPDVHVLATVDESTYEGGTTGPDHPIAWCHEHDGGRAWYTAMGHTSDSYIDPYFLEHLLGGIRYAALGVGVCA